ncbi:site-specific recombinase XerD [Bellilinea caldifistulae]|uniref:Tyr recombinase domain-containing protein n=1 Tax=Bellilinea caldifistulae TaxID=360411 RepID=A0A0P6XZI0_9CHLR|nr:hypothetical protein AC812_12310 [Bellilinea caldifistulae]GAP11787.1 site-specific recombinase XerD [Bellilinea caldifistulae]
MIHRQNYLDVKAYLDFQASVRQLSPGTINTLWSRLRHLLEWADEKPFSKCGRIRPAFPVYCEALIGKNKKPLSAAHLNAMMKTCRAFLNWAKSEYPRRYKNMDARWVESLRPSRGRSEQAQLESRELYTLEEVRKLVSCPADTTAQRRMRAAVAFLFLSGMRVGAFVTLPLECVDLANLRVLQLPAKGVHTKNSKAAVTFLLNIPDLLEVVQEWDAFLRKRLPPEAYWYAHLDRFGEITTEKPTGKRLEVRHSLRDDLKVLCERAGVAYKSPHKFRHGHAVYALKQARTPAQMKAISQNLMHSNMGITDGIYGKLVSDDVRDMIMGLGG